MTECITKQLTFSFIRKHKVTLDFEGGEITLFVMQSIIRIFD
jgi:hypothetical protein